MRLLLCSILMLSTLGCKDLFQATEATTPDDETSPSYSCNYDRAEELADLTFGENIYSVENAHLFTGHDSHEWIDTVNNNNCYDVYEFYQQDSDDNIVCYHFKVYTSCNFDLINHVEELNDF